MRKRDLFAEARSIFPELKPTRIACVTLTDNCEAVVIAGHDERISLVINNVSDLHRVVSACHAALARQSNDRLLPISRQNKSGRK